MRNVRNSDYRAAFEHIKTDLGLSKEVGESKMEALLIYATRDCLGKSLETDMVLAAFGLLKGFDNQHHPDKTMDSDALITARRRMFIRKSSYVAVRHGPHNKRRTVHYNSYYELAASGENAIKAVVSALGSEDGELIDRVAQKLYSHKRQIASYLEESEEYLDIDKDGHIIGVKLQDLIHTNQDKTPPDLLEIETISDRQEVESAPGYEKKGIKEILILVIVTLGLAVCLILLVGGIWLLSVRIVAEYHGQFEVHSSQCSLGR